ncbi:MAG: hypothetical protein WA322_01015 [Pseudolabrys sp.]
MGLHKLAKVCALAAAFVFAGAPAHAETITLKLSHFVPPMHTFHKWVVVWAEKIEKESGGRLKFEIYPNGQLVGPPNRQFDAARNGIAWCLQKQRDPDRNAHRQQHKQNQDSGQTDQGRGHSGCSIDEPPPDEILKTNTRAISRAFSQIPYATEQGIISAEQGILLQEQGIFLVNEIIAG